jgi:hypothetical protein
MAIVKIMCPGCGEDMSIPARALLATIDLEHPPEPLGGLSWVCLSCDDLVNADIEIADLLPLLSVGVLVVNDDFGIGPEDLLSTHGGSRPLENEPGGGSPPFTSADVQILRDLLDTDAWFQLFRQSGGGG